MFSATQAQDVSTLWIKVSDDVAPTDTARLFFCNTPTGTYGMDVITSMYTEYYGAPPPPWGPYFIWTAFRVPAGNPEFGGYPLEIHGIPSNPTVKDTFQLTVSYFGPDADFSNFALEWPCRVFLSQRCDSMFLVPKTNGLRDLNGNPIGTINMFSQNSITLLQPIQAVSSSSFRFHIYKYGVHLVDQLDPCGTEGCDPPPPDPCIVDAKVTEPIIPELFHLHQNYPNPANPSTSISYSLPKRTQVRLQVFNMLGQLMETLVDQEKQPGIYTAKWNASNLPSGLYFYRITAGEFVETKKMALIK